MKLFCKHDYVTKEQTVYCKKCGDHFAIKCGHEWKLQHTRNFTNVFLRTSGVDNFFTCKKCGEWKEIEWTD